MCEDVNPQETLLFPLVEATAVAGSGDLAGNVTESAAQKVSKDLRQVPLPPAEGTACKITARANLVNQNV